MQVAQDTVVALDIALSDLHGNLIERSDAPLQYLHGGYAGIFPLVERALQGKAAGDSVEVQLEPEDAFGEYDAELVQLADAAALPQGLEVGMQLEQDFAGEGAARIYTVTDIAEDKVVLDGNHPLAGIALKCRCTVVAVRAASAEEIERGYADDGAGPLISVVQ